MGGPALGDMMGKMGGGGLPGLPGGADLPPDLAKLLKNKK
jgi:signal recognition particle subunit SRP54